MKEKGGKSIQNWKLYQFLEHQPIQFSSKTNNFIYLSKVNVIGVINSWMTTKTLLQLLMLLHFQDHKTFTKTRRFWPKYSRSSLRLYSPSSKCDGAFFFVFSKLPKHPIPRCYWCYLRCNKLALKWSGIGFQLLSYLYPSVVGAGCTIFYRMESRKKGEQLSPYYWHGSTKTSSRGVLKIWNDWVKYRS